MSEMKRKSLTDLFRAAREDASPSVVNEREAEELLRNQVMHSVPVTQTFGQRLYQRLLSTPLRIGMTAMTIASCITVGIIALWPQTPNNLISNKPLVAHATDGIRGTDPARIQTSPLLASAPMLPAHTDHIAVALPAGTPTPPPPAQTSDSLQPIELSPEQLAQIGVTLEDNGDIDFYTKSDHSDRVNRIGLPPTWGVRLHFGEKISDAEVASLHILKSSPRLITALNGAKRLFSFESDSTYTKTEGGKTTTIRVRNDTRIAPGEIDSNHSVFNDHININVFRDSNTANGSKIDMDLDSNFKVPAGAKKFNKILDIVIKEDKSDISDLLKASAAYDTAQKALRRMESSMDTNLTAEQKSQLQAAFREAEAQLRAKGDAMARKSQHEADSADRADFWMREAMATNSITLERLIPIRVRNLKNAAHPNELIFWYEPTPEITSLLPRSHVEVRQPQHIAVSVYPNPTSGPATIHYELTSSPNAHFIVRNLLGQAVLDGGSASGRSGDQTLDLSRLDAGVYLLVTTTDDGERSVERVVVAK